MRAGRVVRGLGDSYVRRGAVGFGVGAVVSLVWIGVTSLVPPSSPLWTVLVILGLAAGGAVGGAILCGGRSRAGAVRGALAFGAGFLVTWILLGALSYAYYPLWMRWPAGMGTLMTYLPTRVYFPFVIALAYWAGCSISGKIVRPGTAGACGFTFFVGVLDAIVLLRGTGSLGLLNSGAIWNSPVAFICAYIFGGAFYGMTLDRLGGKEAAVPTADGAMATETSPVPSAAVPRKPMSHALRGAIGFGVVGVLAMTAVGRAVGLLAGPLLTFMPVPLQVTYSYGGELLSFAALGAAGGAALAWDTRNRKAFWTTVVGFGVSFMILVAQVPLYVHLQDSFPPMVVVTVSNTLPLVVAAAVGSLFLRATKRLTPVGSFLLALAAFFGFAIGAALGYGLDGLSLSEGFMNRRWYYVLEVLDFINAFGMYIVGGAILGFALDRLERKARGTAAPLNAEVPR